MPDSEDFTNKQAVLNIVNTRHIQSKDQSMYPGDVYITPLNLQHIVTYIMSMDHPAKTPFQSDHTQEFAKGRGKNAQLQIH